MAPLYSQIASNTLISYAGRIISTVFALFTIGFITRELGQEGFGEYTTVLAFVSLFVILADLGLHSLMTREISQKSDGSREIASNFFTLRALSSLFFLILGLGAAFLFPYSTEVKIGIAIAAAGFFFLSIHQLLLGIFQKHLAMHTATIAEVAGRAAQLLFVYAIYVRDAGHPASGNSLFLYLAAMSTSSFLIFLLTFIFAQKYVKVGLRFDLSYFAGILKTTWPIALSIVLTLIYFKIDTIFLSLMKPASDVGIYGAAYRVLEGLIFFPAMFAGIIMPIFSHEAVSDIAHFKEIFKKTMHVITIFAAPLVGGGIILSYSITNLIGGEEFIVAGAPMQALFIAVGIIFFGNILGRAIIALDLQKKAVVAYLSGVVINIVLNLIFIPKYTYMGAAWTTVFTEFLVVMFLFWVIYQKTKVSLNLAVFIKAAFAAAVMSGALFVFASPISTPLMFWELGAVALLGAGIYFAVLYLIRGISISEIKAFLRR